MTCLQRIEEPKLGVDWGVVAGYYVFRHDLDCVRRFFAWKQWEVDDTICVVDIRPFKTENRLAIGNLNLALRMVMGMPHSSLAWLDRVRRPHPPYGVETIQYLRLVKPVPKRIYNNALLRASYLYYSSLAFWLGYPNYPVNNGFGVLLGPFSGLRQ